jgi:hypothetical protein
MFGYTKIELENANVNMLMPQPFSQRHPSYLQRYTSTGDPHIIDRVQEVVALHKVRGGMGMHVQSLQLCFIQRCTRCQSGGSGGLGVCMFFCASCLHCFDQCT